FKRDDLLRHHAGHYQPQKLVIAAAGNVRHDHLVELVQKYFEGVERFSKRDGVIRTQPKPQKANRFEHDKPIQQAHVCLGRTTFGVKNKLRYPLMTLNTVLGDGMSSRLYQNIRERYGFAYSVYSYANLMSDAGTFAAYIGTDASHVNTSIDLILKELEKLTTKPVSNAELQRTKAQLKGSMMLSLESMPSRMMRLGSSELYFGELMSLDTVVREVDAITSEQLSSLANELFDPSKFSMIILNPTNVKQKGHATTPH
ncbi:MAG TPA: pitrilysin family protein, partial [Bacteroidota bacterium]